MIQLIVGINLGSADVTHPGGEVCLGLELLEERREEEGGEEEDDGPEEDVRDVGTVVAAARADKVPVKTTTVLETEGLFREYLQRGRRTVCR